jgi:hypothetical protein
MITLKEDPDNSKAEFSIENIDRSTKRDIRQGFYQLGKHLKSVASKDILAKNKTGQIYRIRRGKVVRRHQASAPGETFANLSGAARRTLGFDVKGSSELEFGFRANQKTLYTKALETTMNRPAIGNTVKKESGNAIMIMESQIRRNHR